MWSWIGAVILAAVAAGAVAAGVVVLLFWRVGRRNERLATDASPPGHARRVTRFRITPPAVGLECVPAVTDQDAVVVWTTAEPAITQLRFLSDEGEPELRTLDEPPTRCHRMPLRDLTPETSYRVQLGAGQDGPRLEFTTLPSIGRVRFCFAAISDTHFKPDARTWPDGRLYRRGREVHERLLTQMLAHGPDFILHKGDVSEPPGSQRLGAYGDAMRRAGVPVHYIPGNHDYFHHPDFARDWARLTGSEDTYHSFVHKKVHFLLLDTCWTGEQEQGYIGAHQLRRLRDDLAGHSDVPAVVVTHHPVFGHPAERRVCHDADALHAVLREHPQVCAILSGHVHRNLVRRDDRLPDVPNLETASGIQYPIGYALYEVGERGLRQSFHMIDDFALAVESFRWSWLRSITNPGEPLGRPEHRNFVLPWPDAVGPH